MKSEPCNIHGTAIAIEEKAALIRGASGSGKSDLAYRCIQFAKTDPDIKNCMLVTDDRAIITSENKSLLVEPPENISGKIELRGIGIIPIPYIKRAELKIVIDLVNSENVPRLQIPFNPESTTQILDQKIPNIKLSAKEPSAHLKVLYALGQI